MSDAKAKDQGDHQPAQQADKPALNNPEGQQVRNASGQHMEAVKAANPNASDGSVKNWAQMSQAEKLSHAENDGQMESFTLVDPRASGDQVVAARQYAAGVVLKSQEPVLDPGGADVDKRPIRDYGWEEGQRGQDRVLKTGVAYDVGKPPLTEQNLFEKIAALPLDQQAQVIGAGIKAYSDEMTHQQFRIGVGAITGLGDGVVGLAQGAESLGKAVLTIAKFSRDVMANDPAAVETAGQAGESFGKLLVGGIKVYSAAESYLESVGAATNVGDYGKPLRDVAWLGRQMNAQWESLTPEEKTRIVTKVAVENLGALAAGGVIHRVAKSMDITGALEELGQSAKNFAADKRDKYGKLIADLSEQMMPQEGLTANGFDMPIPRDGVQVDDLTAKMFGRYSDYVPERKPMFLAPGENRLLKPHELEAFGGLQKLESMSDGELASIGLKRYEMPKLRLERSEYSVRATIPGDLTAHVLVDVSRPGTLIIEHVNRGAMPKGMGSEFLAQTLKAFKIDQTNIVIVKGIRNSESLQAYWEGALPQHTKIGKSITKGLKEVGIQAKSYRYEWNPLRRHLDIVIETGR